MKRLSLVFFILLLPIQTSFAEDFTISTEQSVYYFKIGESATIPLEIENNHGQQISGILQYTISQQINQANAKISSSNTQASTFAVDVGINIAVLDFGTSSTPSTLIADLNFNYNHNGDMNVHLGPIEINFVSDDPQKNNKQSKMQSSSQQMTSPQNSQSSSQQSLQQSLNNMLNTPPQYQDPQQRLQNNQLAQDSSVLKQEIQEQIQNENKLKQEFEKKIVGNEEFLKMHEDLIQEGYEITNGNLNPISNSTGNFDVNYENQEGKWAKIQGIMQNGIMSEIEKQTQEENDNLLTILRNNPAFQKYEKDLLEDGFYEQNMTLKHNENTMIILEYQDKEFQQASVTANFENSEIIDIILEKPGNNLFYFLYIVTILLSVIAAYILYQKVKTNNSLPPKTDAPIVNPRKFDHVLASNILIQEAKDDFKEGKQKTAYGKIGQAVRLFLSHELNINKEVTNEEILLHLDNMEYPVTEIAKCFEYSSLVEFAKHESDEKIFSDLIHIAENLIQRK